MNTKNLAIASTVGVVAIVALLFAYPAMAASTQSPQNASIQQVKQSFHQSQDKDLQKIQFTAGQTITITSVAGGFREVGNPAVNGTASGTLTLKVTGKFEGGYALSTTGGSLVINGTTYTISAGSAEMGPYGYHLVGQAQSGASAQLLFQVMNLGKFGSTDYGVLRVDLSNGSSEFVARLLVTIA